MNISCLIVEDEPLARNLMEQYVAKVPYLQLIKACSSPLDAMEVLRQHPVDLLFLDVQMPEITGINLLRILPKRPFVVLTTAYSEYALEGYELDVVDYLLKPITLERFLKAVEKVSQRLSAQSPKTVGVESAQPAPEPAPEFMFVKDGTRLVRVRIPDILYIEGLKDYVAIHIPGKRVVTLQRMKALEEQLPDSRFIRIHNSYIVAFDAIDSIQKDKVQIGTVSLPISDTYRKPFREFIEKNNWMME